MSRFVVHGGRPLSGEISASGNKNAVLPMIAAALLTDEEIVLENVPEIRDVTQHVGDPRLPRRGHLARRRSAFYSRRQSPHQRDSTGVL